MSVNSTMNQTFNSFAGVDITPIFQGKAIGTIQALSYSINREKAAIYTMGKASPRAFARGKRAIAGSLIFILFDKNPLISHFQNSKFAADADEGIALGEGAMTAGQGGTISNVTNPQSTQKAKEIWYVDQIPPFDVVISAANEYGAQSYMKIIGIELLNENSGFSIDDIVVEQQYTYVATDLSSWKKEDGADLVSQVNHGK